MQKNLIINYLKNMTIEDSNNFIKNNNINIKEEDKITIFNHIKKYYTKFLDDPVKYIKMLKGSIDDDVYYNILMLYDNYKNLL